MLIFANMVLAIEVKELPSKLTLPKALYNHCLELTQSQQLLKLYIFTDLNISYKSPNKALLQAIPKFDKRLKALHTFFNTEFTDERDKQKFSEGVDIWEKSIKPKLLAEPSKENAKLLKKELAEMYRKLKSTKVLAKRLSKKGFEAVKMTGGICYGSQDMVTLYLIRQAQGTVIPNYEELMKKKMAGFEKRLNTLKSLEINTPEIKKALNEAERAYSYFTFMYNSETTVIPALMGKKADEIFKKIESVKKLYGKLLKNK